MPTKKERPEMAEDTRRTVLVHLNVQVPADISLSADVIGDAVLAGLQFGTVPEVYTRILREVDVTVALAQEL